MTYRAVLFDLDGTLLDSNAYWQAAHLALLASRIDEVPAGALDGLVGVSTPEAVTIVRQRVGWTSGEIGSDVRWLEQRVNTDLRRNVNWLPAALERVRQARSAGAATGLVTSSSQLLVDSVLHGDRAALFDVVVTGDDVDRMKPDPQPYLIAAGRLGLPTGDCVAIEDSLLGVASAVAAGCSVVHLGHTGPECCSAAPATDLARLDIRALLTGGHQEAI
ncbi:HAD family hydrolase [Actinoplanes sp. CA-030573]|uniref:HAD family hydrolase n=1 Tax=Actinoplanes sp. CA-030573 TaxID=3239898 RepID=UPI003D93DC8B